MKKFEHIMQAAITRKGGEEQLQAMLPAIPDIELVRQQTDDRMLSMMTQCIFQAGFAWSVVNKKWPEFEIVFQGFNPKALAYLSAEDLEALAKDARIIRNMLKIVTVPKNAFWINHIVDEYGSFAEYLYQWPSSDLIGLLKQMKKNGARLGGNTGQRFLRQAGIDSFILTKDVLQALTNADIGFQGSTSSMRDLKLIQSAFNQWHQQTQLSYTHISKILAYSEGDNYL